MSGLLRLVGLAMLLSGAAVVLYAILAVPEKESAIALSWLVGAPLMFLGAYVFAETP